MLERGYHVVAIDAEPEAIEIVRSRVPAGAPVELHAQPFQTVDLPPADVVLALFSLFFLPRPDFDKFWLRVLNVLKPGGLVAGQLLGVDDDWHDRGYSLHNREEIDALLAPLDVLYLEEVERDGETAVGRPKHWHVFHFVARNTSSR